jgi:hypothetical protein
MLEAYLLHNFREVRWICGRRLGAIRVAVGVEVKIETDVDFPPNFCSRKKILFLLRELVVPVGDDVGEREQSG